jgi:hypothetical protein
MKLGTWKAEEHWMPLEEKPLKIDSNKEVTAGFQFRHNLCSNIRQERQHM